MLISTLVFFIYNILLLPICYVKLWWHKLIMIYVYSKSYRVSRADKFLTFIMFWPFGLPTLILNSIVDVYHFIKHLWMKDVLKTQHKTSFEKLKQNKIESLAQYFRDKNEKILPYKDIATDIRQRFKVFQTILRILQPLTLFHKDIDGLRVNEDYVLGIQDNGNIKSM